MSDAAIAPSAAIAPEDAARADFYALLARLLAAPPDASLLAAIAAAPGLGEDAPAGDEDGPRLRAGWEALRVASASAEPETVRQEYDDLFIGVGKSPETGRDDGRGSPVGAVRDHAAPGRRRFGDAAPVRRGATHVLRAADRAVVR